MKTAAPARRLRLTRPSSTTVRALAPLRVLSLTGGGYRGLFSGQLLVELCRLARCDGRLDGVFDVFAGTSIGGFVACALAVGVAPERILETIERHGRTVFPAKRQRTLRRLVFGTLYEADHLERAIDDCLGAAKDLPLKALATGLVVPAVDWVNGTVRIFTSGAMGQDAAADTTLREVCLATAAAPTYFRPQQVDDLPMLDGGLALNNPDVLALTEVARRWPDRLGQVEMLSIGTAGADRPRTAGAAEKPGAAWAGALPDFMMLVQERSAALQTARVLGDRYLRLNPVPVAGQAAFEHLDVANDAARFQLLDAATAAAADAYRRERAFIDRMLSRQRGGRPSPAPGAVS